MPADIRQVAHSNRCPNYCCTLASDYFSDNPAPKRLSFTEIAAPQKLSTHVYTSVVSVARSVSASLLLRVSGD